MAASGANAAVLYDNINYTGGYYSATTAANVGSHNDMTSSISNSGTRTYYEDSGYLGRSVALYGSWNNLSSVNTNLWGTQTWNDRISSFR